ncbi:PREDICTED: uncharacterized protein LOC105459501 [Wasmannia auropunctata]|uniref:uncharacterized protein LOC105459501 n=1 Tax=Wasmannia auropunctata TaxID=64793 RepID=UPI0005EDED92|nr:PREDICTED: uncharacterized protein LOC105459501 [Wasmannia auropunctata]
MGIKNDANVDVGFSRTTRKPHARTGRSQSYGCRWTAPRGALANQHGNTTAAAKTLSQTRDDDGTSQGRGRIKKDGGSLNGEAAMVNSDATLKSDIYLKVNLASKV